MDNIEYMYKIRLSYLYNNELIELGHENILACVIDYNYDEKNMPIVMITANIDKNLVDDMVLHCNDKCMNLTIYKYKRYIELDIDEEYIKGEFKYFLPSSIINSRKDLDYDNDNKETKDYYRRITIGLLSKELLDTNKKLINEVVDSAGLTDVLTYHLQYRKLLIEPTNNTIIKDFMIPPMVSIASFVDFIDNVYPLYDTQYRLFYNFDKTYLLSSNGKGLKSIDEEYNNVMININNATSRDSTVQGMEVNKESRYYSFQSHISDVNYNENRYGKESFNKIITINEKGEKNIVDLGNSNDKSSIERITTGNINKAKILKNKIKDSSFIINISKTGLDASILTINKQYYIKNNNVMSDKDGIYLLIRNREIYIKEDTNYLLNNLLSFKKIQSQ